MRKTTTCVYVVVHMYLRTVLELIHLGIIMIAISIALFGFTNDVEKCIKMISNFNLCVKNTNSLLTT